MVEVFDNSQLPDDGKGPLPDGWRWGIYKCAMFFVDTMDKKTTWDDPRQRREDYMAMTAEEKAAAEAQARTPTPPVDMCSGVFSDEGGGQPSKANANDTTDADADIVAMAADTAKESCTSTTVVEGAGADATASPTPLDDSPSASPAQPGLHISPTHPRATSEENALEYDLAALKNILTGIGATMHEGPDDVDVNVDVNDNDAVVAPVAPPTTSTADSFDGGRFGGSGGSAGSFASTSAAAPPPTTVPYNGGDRSSSAGPRVVTNTSMSSSTSSCGMNVNAPAFNFGGSGANVVAGENDAAARVVSPELATSAAAAGNGGFSGDGASAGKLRLPLPQDVGRAGGGGVEKKRIPLPGAAGSARGGNRADGVGDTPASTTTSEPRRLFSPRSGPESLPDAAVRTSGLTGGMNSAGGPGLTDSFKGKERIPLPLVDTSSGSGGGGANNALTNLLRATAMSGFASGGIPTASALGEVDKLRDMVMQLRTAVAHVTVENVDLQMVVQGQTNAISAMRSELMTAKTDALVTMDELRRHREDMEALKTELKELRRMQIATATAAARGLSSNTAGRDQFAGSALQAMLANAQVQAQTSPVADSCTPIPVLVAETHPAAGSSGGRARDAGTTTAWPSGILVERQRADGSVGMPPLQIKAKVKVDAPPTAPALKHLACRICSATEGVEGRPFDTTKGRDAHEEGCTGRCGVLPCRYCKTVIAEGVYLTSVALRDTHEERCPHPCRRCGSVEKSGVRFTTKQLRNEHERDCGYRCRKCMKVFVAARQRDEHEYHCQVFPCRLCGIQRDAEGKVFSTQQQRHAHEVICKTTFQVAVHPCRRCGLEVSLDSYFTSTSLRNDHEAGCKLHPCRLCGATADDNAKRHAPRDAPAWQFNFTTEQKRDIHEKSCQSNPVELYTCKYCNKRQQPGSEQFFETAALRDEHEKTCLKPCRKCGRTQGSRGSFLSIAQRDDHEINCRGRPAGAGVDVAPAVAGPVTITSAANAATTDPTAVAAVGGNTDKVTVTAVEEPQAAHDDGARSGDATPISVKDDGASMVSTITVRSSPPGDAGPGFAGEDTTAIGDDVARASKLRCGRRSFHTAAEHASHQAQCNMWPCRVCGVSKGPTGAFVTPTIRNMHEERCLKNKNLYPCRYCGKKVSDGMFFTTLELRAAHEAGCIFPCRKCGRFETRRGCFTSVAMRDAHEKNCHEYRCLKGEAPMGDPAARYAHDKTCEARPRGHK